MRNPVAWTCPLVIIVAACRPAPAARPPAADPAIPPVLVLPIAVDDFRDESAAAAARGGLPSRTLAALPALHRLRALERSVLPIVHAVYEEDEWAPDDTAIRRGHCALLGMRDGKWLALATRCAVDFREPGWGFVDNEPGEPEFVAGILTLEPPPGTDGVREQHLLAHETMEGHALLATPEGSYVDEVGAAVGLDAAGLAALASRPARARVHPIGTNDLALVEFDAPGRLLTSGLVEPLGLTAPMATVERLLGALTDMGDMLETRLSARCEACRERVARAEVRAAPSLRSALARFIPIAGALIAFDAESAWEGVGRVPGIAGVLDAVQEWRQLLDGVEDVEDFLRKMPVGPPILIAPGAVQIERGDCCTVVDCFGTPHRLRLAYCAAREPLGRATLGELVAMAGREKRILVAVPDGRDLDGRTHVHLFVAKPGAFPPKDFTSWRDCVAEGYVNLVMVRRGACQAVDPGVSDGRSTRLVLEALRRVDSGAR